MVHNSCDALGTPYESIILSDRIEIEGLPVGQFKAGVVSPPKSNGEIMKNGETAKPQKNHKRSWIAFGNKQCQRMSNQVRDDAAGPKEARRVSRHKAKAKKSFLKPLRGIC